MQQTCMSSAHIRSPAIRFNTEHGEIKGREINVGWDRYWFKNKTKFQIKWGSV